jgi:hypothetical protein
VPILPPNTPAPINYAVLDIIQDALIEVGLIGPGDVNNLDPDLAQWAFRKVNYLLDSWSARKNYVPYTSFNTYTLVPNLSPHTIGPAVGATYSVPQRPVKIVGATVILNNSTPPVEIVLNIRDEQWWLEQTIKGLTSQQPTDLFYNPTFPNGSLYFWPVPQIAWGVLLECWALISQFVSIEDPLGGPASNTFSIPPGYRNALMLTLAETLLSGGEKDINPTLAGNAAAARLAVFGNNCKVPRMSTRDSGIPGGDRDLSQTTFNYRSRSS